MRRGCGSGSAATLGLALQAGGAGFVSDILRSPLNLWGLHPAASHRGKQEVSEPQNTLFPIFYKIKLCDCGGKKQVSKLNSDFKWRV